MKTYLLLSALSLTALFCAGCAGTGGKTVGTGPTFKGPVGLQLYSLRADFAKDVPGTMKNVKNFGFKYVELASTYNLPTDKFLALLKENGLVPISNHFGYDRYRDNPEAVALEAKALGLKYAGCAWIPHTGNFDEKTCREAIAVFNRAGEVMAKHGIKFFYHTHGYEFQPFGQGTLFDLLLTETKPQYVTYQMDVMWIFFPGQDPVKIMEKFPNRFALMHIKDLKKGVKGDLSGGTDVRNDVALGSGQIDLPAVLRTAQRIGVKWYFIEDESPSANEQIPQSLSYLQTL